MAHLDLQRREITLTRTLNAPRDLVWRAWTDPKQIGAWWGPNGFSLSACEADVREGGALRIVMRPNEEIRVGMGLPPGAEFAMSGVYEIVQPTARLAFTNNAFDLEGVQRLTGFTHVAFDEIDGKTRVTVTTSAEGEGPIAAGMLAGMEQGWSETLDRMVAHAVGAKG